MTEGAVVGARGAHREKHEDEQRTADRAARQERLCRWTTWEAGLRVHASILDELRMGVLRMFARAAAREWMDLSGGG
jgi:hypothetical protein